MRDERGERLTALFLRPFEDATRRAREISMTSEQYDIAHVAPFDDPLSHDLSRTFRLKVKSPSGKGSAMAHSKVSDSDLRTYLAEGHSQADAARHFGLSEAAIHQRMKRLRMLTSQAAEQAREDADRQEEARARLRAGGAMPRGVARPAWRRPTRS